MKFGDLDMTHVCVRLGIIPSANCANATVRYLPILNRDKRPVGVLAMADLAHASARKMH